jgi:phospholipid transport system substrate-binding protein
MTVTRRLFRAAVFAVAVASLPALPTPGQAASADDAATFIRELGNQAITELGDESVPMDKRKARFRELVDKGFAMQTISRFVLGRYARVASDTEMTEFRDVFLRVVAARFLPLFEGYTKNDFHVDGAKPDPRSDKLFLVNSRVRSPKNDRFAKAGWRVQNRDGKLQIVDVIAEGVSMAITLRSEYSSVIQQNGGQVSALITKLEEKVEQGEVEATAMDTAEP